MNDRPINIKGKSLLYDSKFCISCSGRVYSMDKDDLIKSFNSGSAGAFDEVYRFLYPQVFFFACKLVGSEDAKDITAEVFLQLWKREKEFPDIKKIKTFLQVCIRNASINWQKKVKFHASRMQELVSDPQVEGPFENQREIVYSQLLEAIYREIENLPLRAKRIIRLSLEGVDSRAIAAKLNISQSTVRNQKQRAIGILRFAIQRLNLIEFQNIRPC